MATRNAHRALDPGATGAAGKTERAGPVPSPDSLLEIRNTDAGPGARGRREEEAPGPRVFCAQVRRHFLRDWHSSGLSASLDTGALGS